MSRRWEGGGRHVARIGEMRDSQTFGQKKTRLIQDIAGDGRIILKRKMK